MRPESPIEWTGEAHLVTVSCSRCGSTMSVDEDTALWYDEQGREHVCEECE